MKQLQWCWLIK